MYSKNCGISTKLLGHKGLREKNEIRNNKQLHPTLCQKKLTNSDLTSALLYYITEKKFYRPSFKISHISYTQDICLKKNVTTILNYKSNLIKIQKVIKYNLIENVDKKKVYHTYFKFRFTTKRFKLILNLA